ncbi:hypothetical protein [Solibacillus sp. FSL K6-1554]|uniref:hypothetical protein n=1 Tax=Solibacillus sp. FSL K6-1554 TaxID=2921472 RepID=UPI0030F69388
MLEKKISQFTIVDIVERKIHFTKTNTIYDAEDYEIYNEGELKAFNEILIDVKVMTETEFVSKYLEIVKKIGKQMEDEQFKDTNKVEVEKLSGYNNAIVKILECINPVYMYDFDNEISD